MNYSILSINFGIIPNDLLEYKPAFYVQLKFGQCSKHFVIGDTVRLYTPGILLFDRQLYVIKDILSDIIVFTQNPPSQKAFGLNLVDSFIRHW
jgi:hypothetical protein